MQTGYPIDCYSYFITSVGILSIAAVLYAKLGQKQKSDECLSALCSLHHDIGDDLSLPDELLYGRAGYLYSLLFVKTHLGKDQLVDHITEKVTKDPLPQFCFNYHSRF